MYCPPTFHNKIDKSHSKEKLITAWQSIYEQTSFKKLKYKISFTGGEVTTNKNFLPFVEWLIANYKDVIFKILVTTNGSASYRYYLDLFQLVDNISFTVHSEHINEQKFFNTIIKLKKTISDDKFLHVNIMNEFWNIDRINEYIKICKQNKISYTVNQIDYSVQTRTFPIHKGKLNL